jgi:hypothetical protein
MANETPQKSNAWKWWMAGVLFLATVLTYLDRQTLSLCGPMICKEFNLKWLETPVPVPEQGYATV